MLIWCCIDSYFTCFLFFLCRMYLMPNNPEYYSKMTLLFILKEGWHILHYEVMLSLKLAHYSLNHCFFSQCIQIDLSSFAAVASTHLEFSSLQSCAKLSPSSLLADIVLACTVSFPAPISSYYPRSTMVFLAMFSKNAIETICLSFYNSLMPYTSNQSNPLAIMLPILPVPLCRHHLPMTVWAVATPAAIRNTYCSLKSLPLWSYILSSFSILIS